MPVTFVSFGKVSFSLMADGEADFSKKGHERGIERQQEGGKHRPE